ncbi:MAG: hypothetical protein ACYDEY_07690 [Acidimicrobiales bacterium]
MNPPTTLPPAIPPPPLPHGPLARFLQNPSGTLHHLAQWLGHVALVAPSRYGPRLLSLAVVAILGRALVARWHTRRGAAAASYLAILSPPTVKPRCAEAFWSNLHPLLEPTWRSTLHGRPLVAFEIRSTGQRVHFGIWTPTSLTSHVSRAATAA